MAYRTVVLTMWDGPRVVARLGPTAGLTDAGVTRRLQGLGITVPATAAERRARVDGYPTEADLRALEAAYTVANDGVKPVARALESMSIGRPTGAAGSVPR